MDDPSLPPSVPSLPPDVVDDDPGFDQGGADSISLPSSLAEDMGDVERPQNIEMGDSDMINGFDEDDDCLDPDEENAMLTSIDTSNCYVPGPAVAHTLSGSQTMAEYYSPPRILPVARANGLSGMLSLDIQTGWDFCQEGLCHLSIKLLIQLQILIVMLCPPCTVFSKLQRLWNFKKYTKEVVAAKLEHGARFVNHAMQCAAVQVQRRTFFVYEHPEGASSWELESVAKVQSMPGVQAVTFDQCMLGLVSPSGVPMRKRTKFLTNSSVVAEAFRGKMCDKSHEHQTIQGSEHGIRRSAWAQVYPRPMVNLLVQCACELQR